MNKKLDRLIGQKAAEKSGQRLGTNKFHSQSLGTNKSAREIDQNVAEKHGWKWAATSFINENWDATRKEIEAGKKTSNAV